MDILEMDVTWNAAAENSYISEVWLWRFIGGIASDCLTYNSLTALLKVTSLLINFALLCNEI